jgi:sensor histidine kinase YesM
LRIKIKQFPPFCKPNKLSKIRRTAQFDGFFVYIVRRTYFYKKSNYRSILPTYLENTLLSQILLVIMNYNLRLFWLLNFSYWILHYAIQGSTSPVFLAIPFSFRIVVIAIFIFWIVLITGAYRFVYQRLNLVDKSIQFIAIQILIAAAIMAALDIFCRFEIQVIILRYVNTHFFTIPDAVADNAFGRIFGTINRNVDNSDLGITLNQFSINAQWIKFMAYVIWVSAYNFYHIALNLRRKTVEKLAAENRAKDLELITLRSQLNPHFLFNALNSIHSLAMMKKDTASDAVLLLSDLMRYTLNYEKRDLVPLSEEIEVVEKYLQLEKIRFGKKLTSELSISENTLSIKIPLISVQTLVENAIKHGLKTSPNGVFIKIESHLNADFLTINIINSGQLKKEDPSVNNVKNSGIGVENTRRRLQMIYGEKACFDLKNLNKTEVIATLSLPINA